MKYLIVIFLMCWSLVGCMNQKKADDSEKMKTTITSKSKELEDTNKEDIGKFDYFSDSLQINNLKIFNSKKEIIIEHLDLKIIEKEGIDYYVKNDNEFQIFEDEILYFNIKDKTYTMTDPNINVGMSVDVLKNKYARAYNRLTSDSFYDLDLNSFEMFDEQDNRIRVYVYENKVYAISYFINENL